MIGKNLNKPFKIYQSSAGSGKTYTLVKEYIALLLTSENNLKFKQILAVTFTNKAANEMKERVLDSLYRLYKDKDQNLLDDYSNHTGISHEEISARAKQIFSAILHHYGYFNILTIDKFIHRVIRSFTRELDLNVNFEVESDIDSFLNRSIEVLLDQVGEDEDLTEYLIKFSGQMLQEGENQDVEKRLQNLTSLLKEDTSSELIEEFKELDLPFFTELNNQLLEKEQVLESEKNTAASALVRFLNSVDWDIADFGSRKNAGWNALLNQFLQEGKVIVKNETPIKNFHENKWFKKTQESLVSQYGESIRERMGKILQAHSEQQLVKEIKKQLIGFSLLNSINRVFQQVKDSSNIVFLNDFNEIISQIVKNEPAPFIYEKIGTRFNHFLIDEFQDTSVLQWTNLVPLLYNSLGEGNENLIVGDSKQAIYRWRGGEVSQFVNLPKIEGDFTYLNEINRIFTSSAEVFNLEENYRSASSIVSFNNWLFEGLAKNENEKIQKIYSTVFQYGKKKKEGYLGVQLMDSEKDNIQEETLKLSESYLKECLTAGYSYGDIAFLVRTKGDGAKIAEYLESKNYPVVSMDSIVIGSSSEVNFIVNFLKALLDKKDEHSQVKCIRFLTEESLFTAAYEKWRIPNDRDSNYSIGINFFGFINELFPAFNKSIFERFNLYDKVIYIIDVFELNNYDPYIDQFLNTLHAYVQRKSSDVLSFAEYFEEKKWKIPVNLGGVHNAIQVMTIHKSKGLQFPVVIIPYANWNNRMGGNHSLTWIEHEKLNEYKLPKYIAPLTKKSLENYDLIKLVEDEVQETILDNLNLFYVALTRPEDRLYIITSIPKRRDTTDVSSKIIDLLKSHDNFDENSGKLELGLKESIKREAIYDYGRTAGVQLSSLRESLDLSFDNEAFLDELEVYDEKEIGIGVHMVLSVVQKESEVEEQVDTLIGLGKISELARNKIIKLVKNVFQFEEYKLCLEEFDEIYNEKEIITASKEFYRPDKVVVKGKEAYIFDFKTGIERKSHIGQISNYAKLLEEIGYTVVRKYLLYISDNKIVTV